MKMSFPNHLAGALAAALLVAPAMAAAASPDTADAMFVVATPGFVTAVSSSSAFEIKSSELARDKAPSLDVKAFAVDMIADHTKAGEAFRAALGSTPPPAGDPLSPMHAAMIALLSAADGVEFERLYIDMQAGAHLEAVSLFQDYAMSGDDPELVTFAKTTLPSRRCTSHTSWRSSWPIEAHLNRFREGTRTTQLPSATALARSASVRRPRGAGTGRVGEFSHLPAAAREISRLQRGDRGLPAHGGAARRVPLLDETSIRLGLPGSKRERNAF